MVLVMTSTVACHVSRGSATGHVCHVEQSAFSRYEDSDLDTFERCCCCELQMEVDILVLILFTKHYFEYFDTV